MDCVQPRLSRRLETKFCGEPIQKFFARSFPNPHRAIALHVAVTAHRAQTGARFSELSAQQHQVNDLLNIRHRVFVLSQTHRPTKNDSFGFYEDPGSVFELNFGNAGLIEDVTEMRFSQRSFEFFET